MDQFFRELNQQITFMHSIRLDFPSHFHEDIELVYVKNGGGTAFCDGKPYILSKNSFFLVFPNQVHRYVQCSGSEYILLVIKPSKLLANSDIFEQKHPTSALLNFREQSDDNLSSLLEMALTEFERDGHNTVINAYLTAFFEKLLPFYTFEDNGAANDTASQILRYCSEHYKDETITVERIAHDLHISKSTVSHTFSEQLAVHFCDHIHGLRLADATELLKNDQYSITEIAATVGFSTIRTFNRAFLKQYGMSPSAYRKLCFEEQQRSLMG
ncbi:MAG: helix-turn-helix transcriptional regulator [Clostridia bacterium]|nr:helix-turn-helix transcriptional regulator [Clostridia bacterium]